MASGDPLAPPLMKGTGFPAFSFPLLFFLSFFLLPVKKERPAWLRAGKAASSNGGGVVTISFLSVLSLSPFPFSPFFLFPAEKVWTEGLLAMLRGHSHSRLGENSEITFSPPPPPFSPFPLFSLFSC